MVSVAVGLRTQMSSTMCEVYGARGQGVGIQTPSDARGSGKAGDLLIGRANGEHELGIRGRESADW